MFFLFPLPYSILSAPPTAELEPLVDGQVAQTDEVPLKCFFNLAR